MAPTEIPTTMRAWRFNRTAGGVEANLHLEPAAPLPPSSQNLPAGSTLVKILYASLNPVDIKMAEVPLLGRFIHPTPATPGLDFAGHVVRTTDPSLAEHQLVAGKLAAFTQHGALAEYAVVGGGAACIAAVPAGVSALQAATAGVCGLTAYQTLVPDATRPGGRVFIHGGSGGTGTFQIQVAKALGFHVTTSCSTANVQLCKDLGADEVLDYRKVDVPAVLEERAKNVAPYQLVVNNVGRPWTLYKAADRFLQPPGNFRQIGGEISLGEILDSVWLMLPSFLGGGRSKISRALAQPNVQDFSQILAWMSEGKLKAPIDEVAPFEEVPRAYAKLKGHRTRGKIVVKVSEDGESGRISAAQS